MKRWRYVVGVLVVAAVMATLKVYNRPPAPEEPVAGSGGLLDSFEDSNRKAVDDMAQRGVRPQIPER